MHPSADFRRKSRKEIAEWMFMTYVEDDHTMLKPGQLGHDRQGSKGRSCEGRRKYTLCFGLGSQTSLPGLPTRTAGKPGMNKQVGTTPVLLLILPY